MPTQFPTLNHTLSQLVTRLKPILSDNLIGVYLQGSHAVGDADNDSDCDVMIVVKEAPSDAQIPTLNAMHQSLFDEIDGYWSKHLEGSYFPAHLLRKWTPNQPLLHYFDNGSTTIELSDHDNTQVVRWCMREYGITLYGPDAKGLIDEVSAETLKTEIHQTMIDWAKHLLANPQKFAGEWRQSFSVVSYCRMLHTLATGRVHSKPASTQWAAKTLDPKWSGLITRSQERRKDQFLEIRPLNHPADQAATSDFINYALALANTASDLEKLATRP